MNSPGAVLASTVTAVSAPRNPSIISCLHGWSDYGDAQTAALGFVPVAIHFNFFPLLNHIGPVATAEALTNASDKERSEDEKQKSPLCE